MEPLVEFLLPLGQEETYQYDAVGNLIAKTDFNGYTTTYSYDDMYRLTAEIVDSSHPSLALTNAPARIDYAYDGIGNRTVSTVTNVLGETIHSSTMDYDVRSRLASRTTPEGSLAYAYDAAGNLIRSAISDSGSGIERRALDYTHDALNRLESVDDQSLEIPQSLTSYAYDPVGNLDSVAYGNGLSHSYAYDALNRLTDLAVNDSTSATLASYAYELGPAGNRQSVTEASGRTDAYAYDNLYRLISETISGAPSGVDGSVAYTYDAVGNRLSRTATGAIASVPGMADQSDTYDDNDRSTSDTYDDNGNTIESLDPRPSSPDPVADVYDFRNRLVRRTRADGTIISLIYDADGNRVGKIVLEAQSSEIRNTAYLVDLNNYTGYAQVVEEWENSGSGFELEVSYLYGHDLISQTRSGTEDPDPSTHWYLYDGHGSVVGLADVGGAVTDGYEYDGFGVLLSSSGGTRNDYLYAGEQFDSDLGMYFLRARYLNTSTGRFHTMDTYEGRNGEPLTLHKYLYAHGNPVMMIDPSGNLSFVTLMQRIGVEKILRGMSTLRKVHSFRKKTARLCRITARSAKPLIKSYSKLVEQLRRFNSKSKLGLASHHVIQNSMLINNLLYTRSVGLSMPLFGKQGQRLTPHWLANQAQRHRRNKKDIRATAWYALRGAGCRNSDATTIVDTVEVAYEAMGIAVGLGFIIP